MKLHLEVGDRVKVIGICYKERKNNTYKNDALRFYKDMNRVAGRKGTIVWISRIDKWYDETHLSPNELATQVDGINYVIKFDNGTYHGLNRGEFNYLPIGSAIHKELKAMRDEAAPFFAAVKAHWLKEYKDFKEQLNY